MTYRMVAPLALVTVPALVAESGSYVVSARFLPARPGRPVVLERLAGDDWVDLARGVQDPTGRASFDVSAGPAGAETWRVRARAWHGAAQVRTEVASAHVTARLATGLHHTCVVRPDGSAWCWG